MNVTCRALIDTDLPALQPLLLQLGYQLDADSLTGNIAAIRARDGEVFVVTDGARLLGCVAAVMDIRLGEGVAGEIVSLVVDSSARDQGIGSLLLNTAETWLGSRTRNIRVRAKTSRTQAHRFYRQHGYTPVKEQLVLIKRL